jgi:hypothetical protein
MQATRIFSFGLVEVLAVSSECTRLVSLAITAAAAANSDFSRKSRRVVMRIP